MGRNIPERSTTATDQGTSPGRRAGHRRRDTDTDQANAAHDDNLAELLDRLQRRIRAEARRSFEPLGVTPAQVRALRTLERADAPLRMSELADRLGIARRSATDVVEQLCTHGLVDRCADACDRRGVVTALTLAGRATLDGATAARRAAAERLLAPLTSTERARLSTALTRVLTHADDVCC